MRLMSSTTWGSCVLCVPPPSTELQRCTSARSSFFALNSVGSRFGCLHPLTSYRLYQTLCIPILLYGAEIWTLSKVELNMLERVHQKILRTIQDLPTCCHSSSLTSMLGSNFINSIVSLDDSSLPKKLLSKESRIQGPRA